jgi:hypothetical protein
MDEVKKTVVNLLRDIAAKVQALTESEWEDMRAGRLRFTIAAERVAAKPRSRSVPSLTSSDVEDVATRLRQMSDRDAGRSLLREMLPAKESLLRLARYLDLPVNSKETVERLQDRILEGTIGFRLRSQAIQGD